MMFGNNQSESRENLWRGQLDRFVKENQQELAALAWGLWLANGDTQGTIGIDLQPTPHFVYCPQEAVEKLNMNVENRLQEILGIIEHHQPEVEVLMIGIGKGEIKLIQFTPEPAPPVCFEQVGQDVDGLLDLLEQRLDQAIALG
ncbi:beta-carboxysome assembly chaperone CcmS [Nostoc sp. CMAA1605]|uniref:beta-carboxysome assembly chaperone CcmS n=1 Tax=Nostoc sp. CMAA1605 TaxID=2055159 RepID=UPI001F1BBE49|nr:hypothetical protein [Nostoc sp. CMAA1605]MCF4970334.1 hypothetical protein [Nostoc sp. CMAA1605]